MHIGSLKSKLASYTIVWCLVFSMFAGLLVVGVPGVAKAQLPSILPNGDVIIGEDYELSAWPSDPDLHGSTYYMDGNLIVRAGGVVTIEDGTLAFTQDTGLDRIAGTSDDHVYTITVENGGQLILNGATLTTHLNQLFDFPSLGVLVQNGGSLVATDSVLKFPGHILIDESTAVLTNTIITGHDPQTITDFCNNTVFPADFFDDSADLLISSSEVQLIDSRVDKVFRLDSGTSAPSDLFNHNYPFAIDSADRDSVLYAIKRHPSQFGALDTSTGPIANLTADDLKYVTVAPGQRLYLDTTELSGLAFPRVSSFGVFLNVKYQTEAGYITGNYVQYGLQNGPLANTVIRPADTSSPFDANEDVIGSANLGLMSSVDLANLDVSFVNAPGSGGDVLINEVWFSIEFQMETLKNITAAFSSNVLGINSFLDVNFDNLPQSHNQLDVLDNSVAYLYGVAGNAPPESPDRLPAYEINGRTIEVYTLNKGPTDTTTGTSVFDLRANDGTVYPVTPGQVMALQNFGMGGLSGDVDSVVLTVSSTTSAIYASNQQYVEWGLSFAAMENTSIRPLYNAGVETTQSYDLFDEGVNTFADVANLKVRFVNTAAAGNVLFDQVALEVTTTASIYVYRWLDFNAFDEQQLPISGTYVNATVQVTGEPAYYISDAGVSSAPPADVLDYLGKTSANYIQTNESGSALIPLLAEYLTIRDQLWNFQILGPYALDIVYHNATGVLFQDESSVSWNVYPKITEEDQTTVVDFTLENLFLDRPDLSIVNLSYNPSPVYLGDSVKLSAEITNIGLTGARNIMVNITDSLSDLAYETVIPFLAAGETSTINASLTAIPAGLHTVTVSLDPEEKILEVTRNNNEFSIQVNVLPNLPELAIVSTDIVFDSQPAFTGQFVSVVVNVSNALGRADANNVQVSFYMGDPQSGGQLLGTTMMNIPEGAINHTSFSFAPMQLGTYDIFVWVNPSRSVAEYSYGNNLASRSISVELTIDDTDLILGGETSFTFFGTSFTHRGKIVVEDNATLVLDQATLNIEQNVPSEFAIYVRDNGRIVMSQAILDSNRQIWMYLMDNGSLSLGNSTLTMSVSTNVDNHAQIFAWGSIVAYRLIAPTSSYGVVNAYNTTFMTGLTEFGGNALGRFTSVSIPMIRPSNNAVVWLYHWIDVSVVDGNGMKLQNAIVQLARYDIGYPLYASKMTDASGHAIFQALSEIINSTTQSPDFLGNYRLNATYLFSGRTFSTAGSTSVSLAPYSQPQVRQDVLITLIVTITGVAVLSINDGDIFVVPSNPTTNSSSTLSATIHNTGDITATNVNVSFMDRAPSGQLDTIGYRVISSIYSGDNEQAAIDWTPTGPGTHTITVVIKWGVANQIISNNNATVPVVVKNYADLTPTTISFRNGIPLYVGQQAIVDVSVNNIGESIANNVHISFWLGAVDTGILLGQTQIIQIAAGGSSVATLNWVVAPMSGARVQARDIAIEVNPGNLVPETRYDNNVKTQSVTIVDNRPDLVVIGGVNVTTANVSVEEAVIGQTIKISVDVLNDGWTPAMGVVIQFSFVDSDNFVVNIGTRTFDFGPNQTRQVALSYAVGVSGVTIGNYTIKVTVDSNATVNEINEANNIVTTSFVVKAPNPSIDTSLSLSSLKPDMDVTISGQITNSITHSSLSGVQVIMSIWSSQGVKVGDNYTTTTSDQGLFSKSLHVPADLVSGMYLIKVTAIVPGGVPVVKDSPQFQVTTLGSEIGIPLWIWIVIIVLVLVSILIGSWLIYRGLGRMVECGECGALIPEASKRCPKCGVEFESGTAKCSQCGAWIPGNSKECPECGAKFASEPMAEQENEYIKKMRGEYDDFVKPYREQGRSALGRKYSEAKFADWWKKQPSYITFERWLSQEEEKRKVAGTAFPCPVCGTLNPKGSAICHKCGTVFEALKGAEGQSEGAVRESEQKPLRRIVRRPAEKKLIPKKEAKPEEEASPMPEQQAAMKPDEPKSP